MDGIYYSVKHSHCYARGSQPHHPVGESISPVIFMDADFVPKMTPYSFNSACCTCSDYLYKCSYAHDGSYVVTFSKGSASVSIEHYVNDYLNFMFDDRFSSFKMKASSVECDNGKGFLDFRVTTEFGEVLHVSLRK